jgi:hypothetical protein
MLALTIRFIEDYGPSFTGPLVGNVCWEEVWGAENLATEDAVDARDHVNRGQMGRGSPLRFP